MTKMDFGKIEEIMVELFWTVQVYRKKTSQKAMTLVDSFLGKSATKKNPLGLNMQ